MKKSVFLLWLLTIAGICLTACGSKNYEMSFDEALEIASHSAFQDILSNNGNVQQDFNFATNVDAEWTNIIANIQSSSKQNTEANKSDSTIKFDVKISNEEAGNIKVNWDLNIKLINEVLYLNLWSLSLTWSEEMAFISAMAEWFKSQWFSLPMSGLNEISNSYLQNIDNTNAKTKEIVNNEWSVIYEWKFGEFSWYNARKISINNEKLQELINEYYQSLNTLDEEAQIPQLNIENFEWYLVITWKDKVTIVVDNMDLVDEESRINANWFWGENYALSLSSEWEEVISITANKNWSKYDVEAIAGDAVVLMWAISPKVSKSSISINFDLNLTIKSDETTTIIPLKGSRSYEPISEFEVIAPENAQDLEELMGSYLGSMFGWADYDYEDYDYEDYYDSEDYLEDTEIEVPETEEVIAE